MSDAELSSTRPPVAVIGIACRFPGAPDYRTFWRNIHEGRDCITELPEARRVIDGDWPAFTRGAGERWRREGGFLDRVDLFDNEFFNISPREAAAMDPQQRLLLEESYRSFEDAGLRPTDLAAARTSVFAGHFVHDYAENIYTTEGTIESFGGTGTVAALLANRLSFAFGLTGPSFAVNAACASSHVAIHQGCLSLIRGESDFALVCAANLDFNAHKRAFLNHGRFLSPDARCKAFDKDANGYVPSEGVAAILLQPLDRAIAEGRRIHAVIRGTALHHVGRSISLTAPRVESQQELLAAAYSAAGVSPATVGYLEAHGTGTSLGDPIEVEALTRAFRDYTDDVGCCAIGSVKSNIGHTEAAAGLAGLIKVAGMLSYGEIAPTLHVKVPNPIIDFDRSPFRLALAARPWERPKNGPRRAAISSFGFGGAGGHIIVDEYIPENLSSDVDARDDLPRLFVLSAKTPESLRRLLNVWSDYTDSAEFAACGIDDLCGTLLIGRPLYEHRFVALVRDRNELKQKINAAQSHTTRPPDVAQRRILRIGRPTLNGESAEFLKRLRSIDSSGAILLERAEAALANIFSQPNPLAAWLNGAVWPAALPVEQLRAVECAVAYVLAERVRAGGAFVADTIYGEGVGRFAAFCVAGALDLEQALKFSRDAASNGTQLSRDVLEATLRRPHTELLDEHGQAGPYSSASPLGLDDNYLPELLADLRIDAPVLAEIKRKAVLLSENQYTFKAFLAGWAPALEACGAGSLDDVLCAPAGERDLLCAVVLASTLQRLNERWGFSEKQRFSDARFYEFLDLIADEALEKIDAIRAVTATATHIEQNDSTELRTIQERMRVDRLTKTKGYDFLRSRGLRFRDATVPRDGLTLEIGALTSPVAGAARLDGAPAADPRAAMRSAWAVLLNAGVDSVDESLLCERPFRWLALPVYQFSGESYWLRMRSADTLAPVHPLIDENHSSLIHAKFRKTIQATHPILNDHRIGGRKLMPAAALLEIARAAGAISAERPVDAAVDVVFSAAFALDDNAGEDLKSFELRLEPSDDGLEFQFFHVPLNRNIEALETRNDSSVSQIHATDAAPASEAAPFCSGSLVFTLDSPIDSQIVSSNTREINSAKTTDGAFVNPFLNIAAIRARCALVHAHSQSAYDVLDARDMRYGPSLRAIQTVHANDDEALVVLRHPEIGMNAAYALPPALLDGAFQATLVLSEKFGALANRTYVPVSVGSLRVFAALPVELLVYVRRRVHAGERISFDLFLGADDGALYAIVENLTLQQLPAASRADASSVEIISEARASSREKQNPIRFFSFEFERAEPAPLSGDSVALEDLVLFTNTPDAFHSDFTGRVIVATAAKEYGTNGQSRIQIDPTNAEHYRRLLTAHPNARHLIFCADFFEPGAIAPFFNAARALQAAAQTVGQYTLVRLVTAPDDTAGLACAGFARSLRREDPRIDCFVLQCFPEAGGESMPVDSMIVQELSARRITPAMRENEVRVSSVDRERFVRRFRELPNNTNNYTEAQVAAPDFVHGDASPGLRREGVFLITGGAGGIGRGLAGYLAERYRARVILCGRSAVAETLPFAGEGAIDYMSADLTDASSTNALIAEIITRHGQLNGIVHAAGRLEDAYLANKDFESFQRVLAPKIQGVENLDAATRDVSLDFFVSFSSIVAVLGNAGQCDYALANAYLDAFTERRERQRARGERFGKTLAINWPYWNESGGMRLSTELETLLEQTLGVRSIANAVGLRAFELLVNATEEPAVARVLVSGSAGDTLPDRDGDIVPAASDMQTVSEARGPGIGSSPELQANVERDLVRIFARELKTTEQKIAVDQPFARYGVDSLLIVRLNAALEKKFGRLPRTLFFEYANLRTLAGYFVEHHAAHYATEMSEVSQSPSVSPLADALAAVPHRVASIARSETRARNSLPRFARALLQRGESHANATNGAMDIAIIGVSGRYPGAEDLNEYWHNLREGRDCVTEIPDARWGSSLFDQAKDRAAKSYSRWGGFVNDADCFDPLFFSISPLEAERMDPQERLFLQAAWNTLEDAGYTPRDLSASFADEDGEMRANAGVFVGVMWGDYQLFGVHEAARGADRIALSRFWSIANRVSYVMDLHGPSMAVDTACSSSLTAIHLACESLLRGETRFAIAGGVNLSLHPYKYIQLSRERFLASDGRCRSFGEGGDGYVPGEGVGAVLLRPLADARASGDRILGVIKGTAINHGGATNGFTVPSPNAQGDLILEALHRAQVDPRTIGYIEAHGTGTSLGDPIEIAGLARAFREYKSDTETNGTQISRAIVPIGSVKSNIGHLESAAGIAGLTKVLLQMRAGELAPSLTHSENLNPNIDFDSTPFRVQRERGTWQRDQAADHRTGATITLPRRAAISSFGAGGSNAHVIIEEYLEDAGDYAYLRQQNGYHQSAVVVQIVPLSARNPERLRELATRLLRDLEQDDSKGLSDVAYTLRVGRLALEERVALVVTTREELLAGLRNFLGERRDENSGDSVPVFSGNARAALANTGGAARLQDTPADREFLKSLGASGDYERIAAFWAEGAPLDWSVLYQPARRVSLPVYPFARERYWLSSAEKFPVANTATGVAARLHPLLDQNVSTLDEEKFVRRFSSADEVIRDHRLNGRGVLPGAAYVEMARAAGELACDAKPTGLRAVTFESPLFVDEADCDAEVVLFATGAGRVEFEIETGVDSTHACGAFTFDDPREATLDIRAMQARFTERLDVAKLYADLSQRGLEYGPVFRSVQEVFRNESEVFAQLKLAAECERDGYVLHPALLDGAFQSTVGLAPPGVLFVPYNIEEIRWTGVLSEQCYVHVVRTAGDAAEQQFDLTVADESGRVCVEIRGFSLRAMLSLPAVASAAKSSQDSQVHFFAPTWIELPQRTTSETFAGRVVLFGSDDMLADSLRSVATTPDRFHHARISESENLRENLRAIVEAELAREGDAGNVRIVIGADHARPDVLFHLTQLLVARSADSRAKVELIVVSDGCALARACAGFLRTLRLEYPDLKLALLECTDTDRANILARAIFAHHLPGKETRLENTRTLVRRIVALDGSAVANKPAAENATQLRRGGVYVITGGLGGLGVIFAEHLVREYDARVVLIGRRALTPDIERQLAVIASTVASSGDHVAYFETDLSNAETVEELARKIQARFGSVNGILHSAGVLRDGLFANKSFADFEAVLAPKIPGTLHLDAAFADAPLDFVALFSSVASVAGNRGQADYATGNAFLDAFAQERNDRVAKGERYGRTLSINWPLWSSGGMTMDADARAVFERVTGLRALENAAGLRAFEQALALPGSQVIVAPGDAARIVNFFNESPVETERVVKQAPAVADGNQALETALIEMVAALLKIDHARIRADYALSEYGVDSVALTRYASQLNDRFNLALNPSIFFEHTSIAKLAKYLRSEYGVTLDAPVDDAAKNLVVAPAIIKLASVTSAISITPRKSRRARRRFATQHAAGEIAVVGLDCSFPGSPNPSAYWENLAQRRDLISEVPADRWDWRKFAGDPLDANRSVSRWGGFVADMDKFDPLFFGLSPHEAELMDPQQRILLETVWKTIEDAGYRASDLAGRSIGLFVGVSTFDYMRRIDHHRQELDGYFSTGNTHSIVANRISYLLNLRGPSEAVDTACSSSLVALHNALRALQSGDCEAALVGGVNALTDPDLYISFSKAGMLSPDGRCKTFDRDANGYVRGEGAGAVFLKPLERAIADGDHIYGVIRGSAVNHGGRAQSMTAPNPAAQAELLVAAYSGAGIAPETVSYIEAHGTGTPLGDPIEVNGLKQAFAQLDQQSVGDGASVGTCALGSAKTNIGHLEAAAGMAGLIKVLLMFRHRAIPGVVNFRAVNPYIELAGSPFYIADETREWSPRGDAPRRAGVSSFGFGGANAHVVLEEFESNEHAPRRSSGARLITDDSRAQLFPVSAQDRDQLRVAATQLRDFMRAASDDLSLAGVAYTLQLGRENFDERLAVIADSREALCESLDRYLAGIADDVVLTGTVNSAANAPDVTIVSAADDLRALASRWVGGARIDWRGLYANGAGFPGRVSLPTYPFRRERYWVALKELEASDAHTANGTVGEKHFGSLTRLIDANVSTFNELKFQKRLFPKDTLVRDHRVGDVAVLPGAAYLEMAVNAGDISAGDDGRVGALLDIHWSRPVVVANAKTDLFVELDRETDDIAVFEFRGADDTVHADGEIQFGDSIVADAPLFAGSHLRNSGRHTSGEEFYKQMSGIGLHYGPAFQVIKHLYTGEREVFAELQLSEVEAVALGEYRLHPMLLDGAFQSCFGVLPEIRSLLLPAHLGKLQIIRPMTRRMFVHTRAIDLNGGRVARFDLVVADENETPSIILNEFTVQHADFGGQSETRDLRGILEQVRTRALSIEDAGRMLGLGKI